jgi:flavin-dependent dehydrogenase
MARRTARASLPRLKNVVTIAGGGLAGLSLAAGLRIRGIPVVVHEAGSYPRHRVCGEFISGVEKTTLENLGVPDVLEGANRCSSVAWHRDGRIIHEDQLPRPAAGISRHRLDRLLCDRAIALGAEVIEQSRQPREAREGFVWAAGRIPARSHWVGLKIHYPGLAMNSDLEMHLGTKGYVGLARIEEERVNVCGLFRVDRSIRGSGAALLASYLRAGGIADLADRLEDVACDDSSFCAVAGFSLGRQDMEAGLCTIGDAESMIPPFTGNGMSMAFEAAELALDPLEQWSRQRKGWDACLGEIRTRLQRRFRKRLGAAQALHPILLSHGGRTLIESMARARILPFRPLLALVR